MNFQIKILFVSLASLCSISCERSVVIESPFPEKAMYCEVPEHILGSWNSDSIWIQTQTDSLDSTIINKRPTQFYEMDVLCGADTHFILQYTNFSGVVTQEFSSNNFIVLDSTIRLYGELDFDRVTKDSLNEISYSRLTDSTIFLQYSQRLNSDQFNEILIWMKRGNSMQ